jgi:anti-sigma factor RsiW
MTCRDAHLADDEIVALTYASGETLAAREADALAHAAECTTCNRRLADVSMLVADLREAASAEADAQFPDAVLDRQRRQILTRIDQLGQRARILRFPATPPAPSPAAEQPVRLWLAGAAAAGLLAGLLLAETLHLLPGEFGWRAPSSAASYGIDDATTMAVLEDDALLDEIEAALNWQRSSELRALDALTPVAYEIR